MPACSCSSAAAVMQNTHSSGTQERRQGPVEYSPWLSYAQYGDDHLLSSLAPPIGGSPRRCLFVNPSKPSRNKPDLSFTDTDWNFVSVNTSTPYPHGYDGIDVPAMDFGYGTASAFQSLSDSGSLENQHLVPASAVPSSANSQDGHSHSQPSPVSQFPAPVSTTFPSPATSQGDDILGPTGARVEKRRLNTLAARRCRQRRVDRMKDLEAELEKIRQERDDLRLKCSKLEGETDALKGLLSRKNKGS
ncbi:uncharacterized protein N7511_002441 [Penicillium nucicola]|uniref:uncharacterized protein n=1 Tax=Penicillium nucicola TaxID=1850975 RepID=UPI0025450FFA|nr:uncharacterized protein N7511_002441 [Penicillium nucicola]KAJ5770390.1 hypothetical protein N7511_002441 [Penicillium nucicola]